MRICKIHDGLYSQAPNNHGPVFDGLSGEVSLIDLFEGRRQLVIDRVFYDPDVKAWDSHP